MKLEVRVERKHIDASMPRSTTECAIAKALREQHPDKGVWCVWMNKAALWPGGTYTLPDKATQFMNDLLEGRQVNPSTFVLEMD